MEEFEDLYLDPKEDENYSTEGKIESTSQGMYNCPKCAEIPSITLIGEKVFISCKCFEINKLKNYDPSTPLDLNELTKYKSYSLPLDTYLEIIKKPKTIHDCQRRGCSNREKTGIYYCSKCQAWTCKECLNELSMFSEYSEENGHIINSSGIKISNVCERNGCKVIACLYCKNCLKYFCKDCFSFLHSEKDKFHEAEEFSSEERNENYERIKEILLEYKNDFKPKIILFINSLIATYLTTEKINNYIIKDNLFRRGLDKITADINKEREEMKNKSIIKCSFQVGKKNIKKTMLIMNEEYTELNQSNCSIKVNQKDMDFTKQIMPPSKGMYEISYEIKGEIETKNLRNIFKGCKNLSKVDFSYYKGSDRRDINYDLLGCEHQVILVNNN